MKFYAGIGSRTTPDSILVEMRLIAERLEQKGYILRSGGAVGADWAFETGVKEKKNKEIFKPKDATPQALLVAARFHPVFYQLTEYVKSLHGRNAQIVMGKNLNQPVDFLVCWTPLPMVKGGTKLGVDIAESISAPIYNLFDPARGEALKKFIDSLPNIADDQLKGAT